VQHFLCLFLLCATAIGACHCPFSCCFQVSKLFFYPLKVLLPSLFGVHVFVMASVMCRFTSLCHFLCVEI